MRPPPTAGSIAAVAIMIAMTASAGAQWTRRPYQASRYGGNYMHAYHFGPAPSSTPWAPAWSPDGQAVAVAMAGSIWRVDVASGAATELTSGSTYHSSPAWSPDGRWIVYTADDGGKSIGLEVLEVASGRTSVLAAEAANFADPTFSPDGTRLAYTASLPNGYFNVFVRAIANGQWAGEPIQITSDSATSIGRERPYFTAQDMHITPAWLPDGRSLLIVSNRGVGLGSGRVVRVPAETSGAARAVTVIDEQTLYQAQPDVSPDGTRLAYVSARGGTRPWSALSTAAIDGSGTADLVSGEFDVFLPRWSPDGRTIAYLSNAEGLPALALVDVATARTRALPIGARTWKRPVGTIELRVLDRESGTSTAARVHLTASDGRFYAPANRYARLDWAGDRVFHTSGADTLEVPAGPLTLDVVKGFEYAPVRMSVDVAPGRTTAVPVTLSRVVDLSSQGWHSGSTGAHMHGGGLLRYDLRDLLFQAAAEDVAVVNNALAHQESRIADHELFAWGQPAHPHSTRDRLLILGQEYRPPFHGHVAVFGDRHRLSELFPVTIGYEAAPPATLAPSNTAFLTAAKARGAITSYVHAFSGETDPMTAGLGLGKAFMVDAALGTADTIEWASASRGAFVPWYAALNIGLRVTAIGGEDTISNLHIMRLLGCVRTYVHTGDNALTADAWWDGIRRGRTFVTTGPLLDVRVDGQLPGSDITLASSGEVTVSGTLRSITALQRLVIVQDGIEVADIPLGDDRKAATFERRIPVKHSGWVHVRAEGTPADRFPLDALYAQAFTNPVWITVAGEPIRNSAAAAYALKWIDMLQLMADAWPGWTNDAEKQQVFGDYERARAVYRRLSSEATARGR
jgi:TolB protein